jgi:hypothetical protein
VRLALSVLAATLVVAASTGCSSDDEASDTARTTSAAATTEPVSTRPEPASDQSRWAAQVDDACLPWQQQIDAVAPPTDAASLERFVGSLLPLFRKQVAAVKAVKPPADEDEARKATLFVTALGKLERGLTRYHDALAAGEAAAVQRALEDANAAGAQARAYAVSLGITQCGGYESG